MSTHPSAQRQPAWPGAPRRRPRPWWLPVLLLVVLLHLALLQMAQQALQVAPRSAAHPGAAVLVLLPPTVAPRKALPAPPPRDEPQRVLRRLLKPLPKPKPQPQPKTEAAARVATPAAASAPGAAAPLSTAQAAPPAQAAASASAGGSLLDGEAARKAVREAARNPSLAELGAQASGASAPLSEQQRLGREIARGAIGDCLKGEYAGSGMGLLSLPFWLMAELREKCRR